MAEWFCIEVRFEADPSWVYHRRHMGVNREEALSELRHERQHQIDFPTRSSDDPFTRCVFNLASRPSAFFGEWKPCDE